MKKLFTRSFIRALIITVISALVIVGGIYAYQTLWSGKAHITIEPPAGEGQGQLEITEVTVYGNGNWDDTTDTWTVSIARGEEAQLWVHLKNIGDDAIARPFSYINGHDSGIFVAPDVYMHISGGPSVLAAGATGNVKFLLEVGADAEPGILPEIQLAIRTA